MTHGRQRLGCLDPGAAGLVGRLLRLAVRGLPLMYRTETTDFVFTRVPVTAAGRDVAAENRGTSLRYGAIVALGVYWLPEPVQRQVLTNQRLQDFITHLIHRAGATTNVGDVALVCWAAAQAAHPLLASALDRLRQLDRLERPEYVVEAAWVVSALATARRQTDVEAHLTRARGRLLGSAMPGSPVFRHATGPGLVTSYRSHVACFADQVYPIQALARLHRSGDDQVALAAANVCAAHICQQQGPGGQWWWHYDARTGGVIEGYPVYTVHQHAMAPMAFLDLAEAGGTRYGEAIRRGLMWIAAPPELGPDAEPLIRDDDGLTWRKVYRGDPRKLVRGMHAVTTRAIPGMKVPGIGRVYRPNAIDRECRPYELGWLLFAWLGTVNTAAVAPPEAGPALPTRSAG